MNPYETLYRMRCRNHRVVLRWTYCLTMSKVTRKQPRKFGKYKICEANSKYV